MSAPRCRANRRKLLLFGFCVRLRLSSFERSRPPPPSIFSKGPIRNKSFLKTPPRPLMENEFGRIRANFFRVNSSNLFDPWFV